MSADAISFRSTSPAKGRPASEDANTYLRLINASTTAPPGRIKPAEIDSAARDFMASAGLIRPGEERQSQMLRTRWGAARTVQLGDKELVLMNLTTEFKGPDGKWAGAGVLSDTNEVIAVQKKPGGGYTFKKFEDAIPLPDKLKVGLGQTQYNPLGGGPTEIAPDLYYTELTGKNVAEALKDVFTKRYYNGLSAELIQGGGGKADFDPTPGRTWKLQDPKFDLRRGSTAEIHDIYAGQLDGDFQAYFNGGNGHIAPWGSGIRKVMVDGQWKDTLPPKEGLGPVGGDMGVGGGGMTILSADGFDR